MGNPHTSAPAGSGAWPKCKLYSGPALLRHAWVVNEVRAEDNVWPK